MIKGEDIIIFSSIDWDFIWQGHQEIASRLAKNDNRVLFVENTGVRSPTLKDIPRIKKRISNWFHSTKGIRKVADNLFVYAPLVFPFPYSRMFNKINKYIMIPVIQRWMKSLDFKEPIIWVFLPNPLTLNLIDSILNKIVIYYCIDNFEKSSHAAKKIKRTEKALLKKSDIVFATSRKLYKYCNTHSRNVHLFPFGVNIENFQNISREGRKIPPDLQNIKSPIIGYIGGIHKWIDQKLLKGLAEKNPHYSFVFVGPIQTDISLLRDLKNIYFLGQKGNIELPRYVKFFNVGIIPYLITEYTKDVYPTKLNEYLALGKPVISTAIPEVEMFSRQYGSIVRIADNTEGFGVCIEELLNDVDEGLILKRMDAASQNSWTVRLECMNDLIYNTIEQKFQDRQGRWREVFLGFYSHTKKNLIKFTLPIALLYILFFHTPFIWFLGKYLVISEEPAETDVIVALGAGMGESGKVGQGYKERVKYAVELYKAGFAPDILFSSGYTYVFKEAEVMKMLAASLGVPKDAIYIDERTSSTYQAGEHIRKIMLENNWRSMNVVSSPYHMRRLHLILKTQVDDIDATLTPVPNSEYYSRKRGIKVHHIKGIMYEYLAILYYWWKGYI